MENCLVTKLKGVVDNDNLPKFNTMRFYRESGKTQAITVNVGEKSAKIYSDGNLTAGDVAVSNGYEFTGSNMLNTDGTYIELVGKYNIIRIATEGFYFNAEDFSINNSGDLILAAYNPNIIRGDIDALKFETIHVSQNLPLGTTTTDISAITQYSIESDVILNNENVLSIGGNLGAALKATNGAIDNIVQIWQRNHNSQLTLNLDDLEGASKITSLSWMGTGISGNLSALGNCTNLSAISLLSVKVEDDVSELLDALKVTKKSGTINMYMRNNNTLNEALWSTLPKNQNNAVQIDFDASGWSVRQQA